MKKGEKIAMGFVAVMGIAVAGLTLYMESYRSSDPAAAGKRIGGPDSSAALRLIPAGLRAEDLPDAESRGAKVLGLYCGQCHDLPDPRMHTPEEWEAVVARMEQHMQAQAGGMLARILLPSSQDKDVLVNYLHAHSLKPMESLALATLSSGEGQSYRQVCSDCHALPDPAQHTPKEWRLVVARMKQNISEAGRPLPSDEAFGAVLTYLERNAREETHL